MIGQSCPDPDCIGLHCATTPPETSLSFPDIFLTKLFSFWAFNDIEVKIKTKLNDNKTNNCRNDRPFWTKQSLFSTADQL